MDGISSTDQVRELVTKNFAEQGLRQDALAAMEESLLVNDGRYWARTYRAGGCMAMWLVDVRLVQFYGPQGEMLRTIDLGQGEVPLRQAA